MTWLDEILKTHEELESPQSFWRWSALCAVSAVLKDNVWFNKQFYNVYPNIYVMLHANSGLKKGPPIAMANRFVSAVNNTHIITGRSSVQAILKEMGKPKASSLGGNIGNSCFICSSELTSSIVTDPVAMNILTDLYDRNWRVGEWRSLLKMETFVLKNPTVCMLSGTNEAHTDDFFAKKDIHGGYFARTFIIYEKQRHTVNSLMFPLKNPPDDKKMALYLHDIAKLKGEFQMSLETRKYFDEWYKDLQNTIIKQEIKDPTGTLNRFDDSVLKVAMLTSLAQEPSLVITQKAIEQAIRECEKLIGNVRRATIKGNTNHEWAAQKSLLLQELLERDGHQISRQMLNNKYYLHANANQWDEICESLKIGGHISIDHLGSSIIYRMTDKAIEHWTKFLQGKNK